MGIQGHGEQLPSEGAAHLVDVFGPPRTVHREKCVSPGRNTETGVYADDGFGVLAWRFSPAPDLAAVFCSEAWSAGNADDGAPAGGFGPSLSLTSSTRLLALSWMNSERESGNGSDRRVLISLPSWKERVALARM
ncbi:hypothetical protein D3C80_1515150 [compost metagenome]